MLPSGRLMWRWPSPCLARWADILRLSALHLALCSFAAALSALLLAAATFLSQSRCIALVRLSNSASISALTSSRISASNFRLQELVRLPEAQLRPPLPTVAV